MVFKSIKKRWAINLRKVLPETKLPISALWRCSVGSSDSYDLGSFKDFADHPISYLVCDVKSIDFDKLTAAVDVFYPEEENSTEMILYLHELSLVDMDSGENPAEEEDMEIRMNNDELKAANAVLDHVRFFYNVVWFPWDERQVEEMDDTYVVHDTAEDWVTLHLEHRMIAYKEYHRDSSDVYDRLKKLAYEYDHLIKRLSNIAPLYENDIGDNNKDDFIIVELHEIEDSLDTISKQADRLENPPLRKAFEKVARLRKIDARNAMLSDYTHIGQQINRQVMCLVTGGNITNLKGMTDFMVKAQQKVGIDMKLGNVMYRDDLQSAIDDVLPGDIIILPPGEHVVKDWGDLKEGGSIYGVDSSNPSLIELQTMAGRYGMEISNGAVFENIIISSSQFTNNNCCTEDDVSLSDSANMDITNQIPVARHGILVKSGVVHMINCTILGLQSAVKVMANAGLVMKRCKLNLNHTGIIAEKMSDKVVLEDVRLEGNGDNDEPQYGIVIFEDMAGANFSFNNVSLRYIHSHFVFVDPGFFSRKEKTQSILYFKDSWDDVLPLLSKSVKNNLFLESPATSNENATDKTIALLVVANLLKENNVNIKYVIATNGPANSSLEGEAKTNDNLILSQNFDNTKEVYVTASGNILTPNCNVNV